MKQWFSRQWMLANKGQWWLRDEKRMLWVLRSPQLHVWREALGHGCFPGSSVVRNSPANIGDSGLILGSRRSPGGRNGNLLQYSCQEMPWTEEPGGIQSMGSPGIRRDWVRLHAQREPRQSLAKDKTWEVEHAVPTSSECSPLPESPSVNPEALQILSLWDFMEASVHRHSWLNHWPSVIELNL